jgi:O-antigen ligase
MNSFLEKYRQLPFERAVFYSSFIFILGVFLQDKTKIILTLGIATVSFFWLIQPNYSEKWKRLKQNKASFFLILFYLWQVVSIVWTQQTREFERLIVLQISLFLFSLVWSSTSFTPQKVGQILKFFILLASIHFGIDILFTIINPEQNLIHAYSPISGNAKYYLALYSVISIFTSLKYIFNKPNFIRITLYGFAILLGLIEVVLLSSRIFLVFIVLGVLFLFIYKKLFRYKLFWKGALVLTFLSSIFIWIKRDHFETKILETKDEIDVFIGNDNLKRTNPRVYIWADAYKVIKENFFIGTGLGDEQNVITEKARNRNIAFWIDQQNIYYHDLKLNYHSQYLQIFASVGIVGLLLFLMALFYGVKSAIQNSNKSIFLIVILFAFIFGMLTESILLRQYGVVLFAFFFPFLSQKNNQF